MKNQDELDIICPRDRNAVFTKNKYTMSQSSRNTQVNGYYQVRRNDLSSLAKAKKTEWQPASSKMLKINNNKKIKDEAGRQFEEDGEKIKKRVPADEKSKKITKSMHYNQVLISDDSSDISFTEVKLAQLYSKSNRMQKELVKAFKDKDNDKKFQDAMKNVLTMEVVKQ